MSTRPPWWRYVLVPILALITGWIILAELLDVYVRVLSPDARSFVAKLYDRVGTRLVWPLCCLAYTAFLVRRSLADKRDRIARERAAAGLCPQCGYDLRAGHERCPECGYPMQSPIAPLSSADDAEAKP